MAELAVLPEVQKGYSNNQLLVAMSSERWAQMAPNTPTAHDLHPGDLWPGQVESLVDAMLDPAIVVPAGSEPDSQERQRQWEGAPHDIDVPGTGILERVGFGESRICYKLTTPSGQSMAVIYGAYMGELGLQMPEDPHLTLVNETWSRQLYRYSDLRTYMCIPTGPHTGVMLQEFGGTSEPTGMTRVFQAAERVAARRQAQRRIAGLDVTRPDLVATELAKPRHYLYKPDRQRARVIDIPVEVRTA